MIILLIGVIVALTIVIVILCVRICMSESRHRQAEIENRARISMLESEHERNEKSLEVFDILHVSMQQRRLEMDRMLIDAALGKGT